MWPSPASRWPWTHSDSPRPFLGNRQPCSRRRDPKDVFCFTQRKSGTGRSAKCREKLGGTITQCRFGKCFKCLTCISRRKAVRLKAVVRLQEAGVTATRTRTRSTPLALVPRRCCYVPWPIWDTTNILSYHKTQIAAKNAAQQQFKLFIFSCC